MAQSAAIVDLSGKKQYRIIPSTYPPINFFEGLVDPAEMEVLFEIEGLTNERLRQEVGDIFLVAPEDRVSGPGSSVVMAAFTHIGRPSRFTDGSYGVYYASLTRETAIFETVYHRERFLMATKEPAGEITMRVYEGELVKPLKDLRGEQYQRFHDPHYYLESQQYGRELREAQAWGLIYNSVRHIGGCCIAAFRPKAVSIPVQQSHLRYRWNGEKIVEIFDINTILSIK